MTGGYTMIDGTGIELTSETSVTVDGIFAQVDTAYKTNKPCFVYNTTWENDIMTPIAVMINPRSSGNYIATASTLQIIIDPNDGIEIINMLAT